MILAEGVARPLKPSPSWDRARPPLPSLPAPSVPPTHLLILLLLPHHSSSCYSPPPQAFHLGPPQFSLTSSLPSTPGLSSVSPLCLLRPPTLFPAAWPSSKGGQLTAWLLRPCIRAFRPRGPSLGPREASLQPPALLLPAPQPSLPRGHVPKLPQDPCLHLDNQE